MRAGTKKPSRTRRSDVRRLSRNKLWPAGGLARRAPRQRGAFTLLDTCSGCGHSSSPFIFARSDRSYIAGPCLDVWRPRRTGPKFCLRPLAIHTVSVGAKPPKGARQAEGALCVASQGYLTKGLTWDSAACMAAAGVILPMRAASMALPTSRSMAGSLAGFLIPAVRAPPYFVRQDTAP